MPGTSRKPALLAFFGHHKGASTYVSEVVDDVAGLVGLRVRHQHLAHTLPLGYHLRDPFPARIRAMRAEAVSGDHDILCHVNADRALVAHLSDSSRGLRGFHLIRDPRDILISGYFSHKVSHPVDPRINPWLIDHRRALADLDPEDGLLRELEYSEPYFRRMGDWDYSDPRILETRYERLVADPPAEFRRIFRFLGLAIGANGPLAGLRERLGRSRDRRFIPRERFAEVLDRHSFARRSRGRSAGTEDVRSHYRKGVAGDWANHFTPRVKDEFKRRHGDLLIRLGYERDDNW